MVSRTTGTGAGLGGAGRGGVGFGFGGSGLGGSGFGGGGAGGACGTGAVTNSAMISAGTTTSMARCSRPDWKAQSTATCRATTEPAMTVLRELCEYDLGM